MGAPLERHRAADLPLLAATQGRVGRVRVRVRVSLYSQLLKVVRARFRAGVRVRAGVRARVSLYSQLLKVE